MNAQAVHAYDGADRHVVTIGQLRVLVCEDGGDWFAQGVEIDYSAIGSSLEEVQRRFEKGLAATVHLHLSRFQSIERLLKFAPESVWGRLSARDEFKFNQVMVHDLSNLDSRLHALPFGRFVYLKDSTTKHAASA